MRDYSRFGIWTLAMAIGFVAGLIMALITVWHLWADVFHKTT